MLLPYDVLDQILVGVPKCVMVLISKRFYNKYVDPNGPFSNTKRWIETLGESSPECITKLLYSHELGVALELSFFEPRLAFEYSLEKASLMSYVVSRVEHVSVINMRLREYNRVLYMVVCYYNTRFGRAFIIDLVKGLGIYDSLGTISLITSWS